ncbi:MAG: sigma-70 family RNA polymerase sigma factor [Thermoanaerobaculia bacterium]|nr:sigma-70 family RNA polymerase sigma factor [Thermoanaerobaculia bacterium]
MARDSTADSLLAGEPQSVEQVRKWIRSAMYSYRNRFRDDSEDLEQEVLLQIIEAIKRGQYEGRSSFSSYVKSYVRHKAIDRIRAARRREWVGLQDLELTANGSSPFEKLSDREHVAATLRALRETPESCRALWVLLRQGLGYSEMSRVLGIAEGTLRVRVLRCRRMALELRKKYLREIV